MLSVDRDQHNDRGAKSDQDVSDLLVGQRARSEIFLGLVCSCSESSQFLVTQRWNGFFDLDGIELRRFQRFLSRLGRKKILDLGDILLPRTGNREGSLLQFRRRNNMTLSRQQQRSWKQKPYSTNPRGDEYPVNRKTQSNSSFNNGYCPSPLLIILRGNRKFHKSRCDLEKVQRKPDGENRRIDGVMDV